MMYTHRYNGTNSYHLQTVCMSAKKKMSKPKPNNAGLALSRADFQLATVSFAPMARRHAPMPRAQTAALVSFCQVRVRARARVRARVRARARARARVKAKVTVRVRARARARARVRARARARARASVRVSVSVSVRATVRV